MEETSVVEGTERGKEGKRSGTKMPSRVTTIPPLRKSCANTRLVCCLPLYLAAMKLKTMKARPPTRIHGNQEGIIGEFGEKRTVTERRMKMD